MTELTDLLDMSTAQRKVTKTDGFLGEQLDGCFCLHEKEDAGKASGL